ncbi:MAG: hypothetical protein RIS76_3157 [Verrucomicrobiota bacterium]
MIQRSGWDGFTLIELLVVFAIIPNLAGLLLPALAQRQGSRIICTSNLKSIAIAMALDADDHREPMPNAWWYNAANDSADINNFHYLPQP